MTRSRGVRPTDKRKARTTRLSRWEERSDKGAQSTKNHLRKMIPKLDKRDQNTFFMLEPFTEDECDLLTKILVMIWNREDPRTLLYRPASGKSRPIETERDRAIFREYTVGLTRDKPKVIRGELAEKYGLDDETIRKIVQKGKKRISTRQSVF